MPSYGREDPYRYAGEIPEARRAPASTAPAIRGEAAEVRPTPANVSIIKGHQRIGTTERDRYRSHVDDLWSSGHMSDAEHDARLAALDAAEVNADLQLLISDLPPLPLTEEQAAAIEKDKKKDKKAKKAKKEAAEPWNQANVRLTSYVAGLIVAAIVAIVPAVIVTNSPAKHTFGIGPSIAVICGIAGGLSFVVLLVWTCYWLSELVDWNTNSANKNKIRNRSHR